MLSPNPKWILGESHLKTKLFCLVDSIANPTHDLNFDGPQDFESKRLKYFGHFLTTFGTTTTTTKSVRKSIIFLFHFILFYNIF